MPREGAGPLPALPLDQGSLPYQPPAARQEHLAGSSARGRSSLYVIGEATPHHHVLRAGLGALVVALDPVRLRPLSRAHRLLRPLPRCAGRAGHHPRQERDRRSAAADGALASRTEVVRRGALAPCGDRPCRNGAKRPARRPGPLRGRSGRLDGSLLDLRRRTPNPRYRRQMGGWDIVIIMAWTLVLTWVYNGTGGSVLIVMLFHAMFNTVSLSFISPMFSGADSVRQSWLLAAVWCAVAVAVVVVAGPKHLSRKHRKQEQEGATESGVATPPGVVKPTPA